MKILSGDQDGLAIWMKRLERGTYETPAQSPPDPGRVHEQTLIARFPGLTSWWECPVPLTGVYSRDLYADGHEQS